MKPNERAQQNHNELFPGHVSTLVVTDPELIATFDNFAFDEVLAYGDLDTRTRLMIQLAALIASQALREYRVMVGAALTVGVSHCPFMGRFLESRQTSKEGDRKREDVSF
jgi:4-carboxymuconolactone decarboxylase